MIFKALRHLVWLPLLLGASPAFAHAPIPGIKGFYIGLLHPFSTPAQALLMLGLGLLLGGFSVDRVRWLLGSFLVCGLIGLIVGTAGLDLDAAMYAVAVAACSLAALIPGRVLPLAIGLTIAGSLLIGSASIPDAGLTRDRIITMSGSMVGANIGLLYIWGLTHFIRERYRQAWVGIGFRVATAWIGAVALLMLAMSFAETAPPA